MKTLTFDPSLYVVVPRDLAKAALTYIREVPDDRGNAEQIDRYQTIADLVELLVPAPPLPEQPQGDNQANKARKESDSSQVPPLASRSQSDVAESSGAIPGEVVVTTNGQGQCVAVTRQNANGQILSVIWEAPPAETAPAQGDDKQVLDWINKDWVPDPEPPTGNDARFIRAAGAQAVPPTDVASAELRTRALAYLALAEKATPGLWESYEGGSCVYAGPSFLVADCDYSDEVGPQHHLDAAFIAASHEAAAIIRELLNETKP